MNTVSEADARAMVRLLGVVCLVEGSHADKKRHLMDGLSALVDADYWAWAMAAELEPGHSRCMSVFSPADSPTASWRISSKSRPTQG